MPAFPAPQQMMAAKDAQELAKINTEISQPNVQKLMDYSRSVYDLVTQLQQQVTAVMDSQYNNFSKKASRHHRPDLGPGPGRRRRFAAAMKSMLDATNQAFGNMQNMAKQMTEIADANLQAASSVTAKAVGAKQKEAVQLPKKPGHAPGFVCPDHARRSRDPLVAPGPVDAAPLDFDADLAIACRPAPARPRRRVRDGAADQRGGEKGAASDGRRRCAPSGRQRALVGLLAGQQERLLDFRRPELIAVERLQRPLDHRVRHLRKAGHEVMMPAGHHETGDAVERVRHDLRAGREGHQLQALRRHVVAEADLGLPLRLRD